MKNMKLNIQKFAGSTFEFGPSGYLQGRIIWSSTSNGSVANSSNVSATLQIHRTNSATTTGTFSGALNINGDNRGWSWYGSISNGWVSVTSFTVTVGHEADGSRTCYIGGSVNGPSGTSLSGNTSSGSQTVTLDKINRYAIITNAMDFNDEQNPTVTFTNPGNFPLALYLTDTSNNIIITRTKGIYTSPYTFQLTDAERNTLRSKIPNSNSMSIRYSIGTYLTNTDIMYNTLDKTMTIINANPQFSTFTFEDINSKTLALTGNSQHNINGYSTIRVIISTTNKAIAKKYATMKNYRFSIGSQAKTVNYSSTTTVNLDITNASTGTYQVYATDSRNNTTLVTKLSTKEINYTQPLFDSLNCKIERNNNGSGQNGILTINGTFWNQNFGVKSNSIKSVSYQFKKTTDSQWKLGPTQINLVINGNKFSFNGAVGSDQSDLSFDLNSSYDFKIIVTDELTSVPIQLTPMGNARPHIAYADDGIGFMGAYDENIGGLVQIGGKKLDIDSLVQKNNGINYVILGNVAICWGEQEITFNKQTSTDKTITLPITYKDTNYKCFVEFKSPIAYFTYVYLYGRSSTNKNVIIGGYNTNNDNLVVASIEYFTIGLIN